MSNGTYVHLGFEGTLVPVLELYNTTVEISDYSFKQVLTQMPLVKSSKSQIWPISVSILNINELNNIVHHVGIFHGSQRPQSFEEYFSLFMFDILKVLQKQFIHTCLLITVEVLNTVCDAAAKSFLLIVKSPNAYFGC